MELLLIEVDYSTVLGFSWTPLPEPTSRPFSRSVQRFYIINSTKGLSCLPSLLFFLPPSLGTFYILTYVVSGAHFG